MTAIETYKHMISVAEGKPDYMQVCLRDFRRIAAETNDPAQATLDFLEETKDIPGEKAIVVLRTNKPLALLVDSDGVLLSFR